MAKKVAGISILLVLIGIMIFSIISGDDDSSSAENQTGAEGAYITSNTENIGIKEGETPPDFELETTEGETFRLSDLKGKKVILNFWATWCPPCKEEMPELQKFHDDHKDEVEIIAVNSTSDENSEQDVYDFIEQHQYTYTFPMDREGEVMKAYNIFSYPTTYFIGTDGVVQLPVKIGPMTYEFMEESVNSLN